MLSFRQVCSQFSPYSNKDCKWKLSHLFLKNCSKSPIPSQEILLRQILWIPHTRPNSYHRRSVYFSFVSASNLDDAALLSDFEVEVIGKKICFFPSTWELNLSLAFITSLTSLKYLYCIQKYCFSSVYLRPTVCDPIMRGWLSPHLISPPKSTPTRLPMATLCQSRT